MLATTDVPSPVRNPDELQAILKAFRYHLASKTDRRAFHIFSNKTLELLVSIRPKTILELLRVPGISLTKAEEFGEELLVIIHRHETGLPQSFEWTHFSRAARRNVFSLDEVLDDASEKVKLALRQFRYERSTQLAQPAYVIFTNQTLLAIAEKKPTTLEELATIYGIGQRKLEDHGEAILDVVRQRILAEDLAVPDETSA
ncbi:HRDC domain-containing protein [Chryseomicrobium sp. FSL W7-1435]|uniref:HRDC domain-containing protein n=1 Tax=Chryseomicrobium sp. FSL W7-1435 TaxID=2921704 RepID=UPI00315AA947